MREQRKIEDLTGMRFGRLLVVRPHPVRIVESAGRRSAASVCKCDCGKEVVVRNRLLKQGFTTSCGCRKKEVLSENGKKGRLRIRDLTGMKFGRLTVVAPAEPKERKDGRHIGRSWVRCECGKRGDFIVVNNSLLSGLTTSCGCRRAESLANANRTNKTTGLSHSRLYNIFKSMHSRCENQKHEAYQNYGGKGIKVCEEWRRFEPFCEWALANGYDETKTIDRIDNDKGYFKENCRWVTMRENQRNKKFVWKCTYNGRVWYVSDIAKFIGMSRVSVYRRIKEGWSLEDIFTVLPNKGNDAKRGIFKERKVS